MSNCEAARALLMGAVRGRLSATEQQQFDEHLRTCPACERLFARERELDRLLLARPPLVAPASLRAKLEAQLNPEPAAKPKAKPKSPWLRAAALGAPAIAVLLVALLWVQNRGSRDQLSAEAVNDHLRVLYASHPLEIENGGMHQVKPWFAGRLDFAPVVGFMGDEEFPLQGGAVGVFIDRKAATLVFKRRLHVITLFVFRAEGLHFPVHGDTKLGSISASSAHERGFNALLWNDADLGYALVSDLDATELAQLGQKLAAH